MAYFEDLTPYRYSQNTLPAFNVGWLSSAHSYNAGYVPAGIVEVLLYLTVTNPVNQCRGFHECEFCKVDGHLKPTRIKWQKQTLVLGSSEIWIGASPGKTYASPNLIAHYIECHQYVPPDEYLQELQKLVPEGNPETKTLSEHIITFADRPTRINRIAFFSAFLRSRVGSALRPTAGLVQSGDGIAASSDHLTVPIGSSPNGDPVVILMADIPLQAKDCTSGSFVEIDAKDAIKIAFQHKSGIIVQGCFEQRKAWAHVTSSEIIRLAQKDE